MRLDWDRPVFISGLSGYPAIKASACVEPHAGVARLWREAGLEERNPLGNWIRPGMRVLVKPNWVRHAAEGWSGIEPLVTHPSVLRPVVEAVGAALTNVQGEFEGEIVLADAPLQGARFDTLMRQCGVLDLISHWRERGLPVQLADLRRVIADTDDETGVVNRVREVHGDPKGDTVVNLQRRSRLEDLEVSRGGLGVSNYESGVTSGHHGGGRHCYRIANSLLEADVVVNLPKWKTHVKTGVTGAMKNFIGVNCDKAYLPHFRVGSPRTGGDEYPASRWTEAVASLRPRLERMLPAAWIRAARQHFLAPAKENRHGMVFGGAWAGNDTLWRTVHDMAFIARWMGPGGVPMLAPRPILTVMDAIVAGEGNGPLRPQSAQMGCLLFGTDPGWMDIQAAALSGFDWLQIPVLRELGAKTALPVTRFNSTAPLPSAICQLMPPAQWSVMTAKQSPGVFHEAA
jgi:uncharacterized protein (DUF362 family)